VAGGAFLLVGLAVILSLARNEPGRKKPPRKEEDHPVAVPTPTKKTSVKVDDAWLKEVAAMSAEKQVDVVAAKLKELNTGFDGKVVPGVDGGVVTSLEFLTDNVTDISPVRALPRLRALVCSGTLGKGQFADLSPLKGMRLTNLFFSATRVSDLSPLKGMNLRDLYFWGTPVADLSPLKDMKLTALDCGSTKVSDLAPLKDMKLTVLHFPNTAVSDLSPLKGMSLTNLNCADTKVSDLSPLTGMPLKQLWCDFKLERDAEILRSIKTLEKINGKPAKEFWKEVEAREKRP
jgi:Leucine-rich repeat (LRR) protein